MDIFAFDDIVSCRRRLGSLERVQSMFISEATLWFVAGCMVLIPMLILWLIGWATAPLVAGASGLFVGMLEGMYRGKLLPKTPPKKNLGEQIGDLLVLMIPIVLFVGSVFAVINGISGWCGNLLVQLL